MVKCPLHNSQGMESVRSRIKEVLDCGHLMRLATFDSGGVWVADLVYISDEISREGEIFKPSQCWYDIVQKRLELIDQENQGYEKQILQLQSEKQK